MGSSSYVHGYTDREGSRLLDQATTLAELLHAGTRYPPGAEVLEAGCGVGAQTVLLARHSPGARLTSVDVSAASLAQAAARAAAAGLEDVRFVRADLLDLPFPAGRFDHVFVCFVLEHLRDPRRALEALRRQLRPGGTLTVIEGDHGSTLFHPDGALARRAVASLVEAQAQGGGDALVGRRLFPLLSGAGLAGVSVSPRTVYVDGSRRSWAEGFTRRTFTAMVEGARDEILARGLMTAPDFDVGVAELRRAAEPDGVFFYTFFKGVGVAPG
jgi:protein-L-isoaspartate O-methyltransferase